MSPQMEHQSVPQMSLDEILEALDQPYDGTLPVEAIQAARRRRDEIVPELIEMVRDAMEIVRRGRLVDNEGHFFSLYLLAEFGAKEALPTVLEVMRLSEDELEQLYGDAVTENFHAVLAALTDDTGETLDELISDPMVNRNVKWGAAEAFLHLVKRGRLTREQAVQRLQRHLARAMDDDDCELTTFLVAELEPYAPGEAQQEIREAFDEGFVDTTLIDFEHIEEAIREGDARFQRSLQSDRLNGITNTVELLQSWHAYSDEAAREFANVDEDVDFDEAFDDEPAWDSITVRHEGPRVGRNDPCPCGSGKKFKKCCARG